MKNILSILIAFVLFTSCDSKNNSQSLITSFTEEISSSNSNDSITLTRISPSGDDVLTDKQIVFQFNKDIVQLGEMARNESEIPIVFHPRLSCNWRWISLTTLACQLKENDAIAPATKYSVSLTTPMQNDKKETQIIRIATNNFLVKENRTTGEIFTSQRPVVNSYYFNSWNTPGKLTSLIYFSQTVTKSSVEKHLYFETPSQEKISAIIVPGPNNEKALNEFNYAYIQPEKELPLSSSISLKIEPGLQSVKGSEHGIESREIVTFNTHEEPRFLGVRCCVEEEKVSEEDLTKSYCSSQFEGLSSVLLSPDKAVQCNPQASVSLAFSSPIEKEALINSLSISPALSKEKSLLDLKDSFFSYSSFETFHEKGKEYLVYLPYGLLPSTLYETVASDVKDIFGRKILNTISAKFKTSDRLPRFVVDDSDFVLEKNVETHLPSVVQNIDSINLNYSIFKTSGTENNSISIPVDNVPNLSYFFPIKVRSLINGSGIIKAGFSTSPDSRNSDFSSNDTFTGQITPFHVNVKYGHFNTLVWVTNLSTGNPEKDVKVSFLKRAGLLKIPQPEDTTLATAITDDEGFASLPGSITLDKDLSLKNQSDALYVLASKQDDLAYIPINWSFRTGAYAPGESKFGYLKVWGMTPQGIYKLGDTIEYKIVVRNQDVKNLIAAPKDGYSLSVIDPMGKIVHSEEKVTLSEFGTFVGSFSVPKNGAAGLYEFKLTALFAPKNKNFWTPPEEQNKKGRTFSVMQLLVTDFTPAPFKVSTEVSGEIFHPEQSVPVDVSAKLHAGGAYIGAPVSLKSKIKSRSFDKLPPSLSNFTFSTSKSRSEDEYESMNEIEVSSIDAVLSEKGEVHTSFIVPDSDIYYGDLFIEASVQDDRGKSIANSVTKKYAGPSLFVGGRFNSWVSEVGKETSLSLAVVDDKMNFAANAPVSVSITRTETTASQVKSEGNAYITRYENKEVPVSTCSLTSTKEIFNCSFTPSSPGIYSVIATVTDKNGKVHSSKLSQYVIGSGELVWNSDESQSIDLVPEKNELNVGDTAKILVKNPFPGTKGLLTIERYGIISKKIITLDSATPIIEIPITEEMIPGFYAGLSIFSPRVDAPLQNGSIDLGKPALRIGSTKITVSEKEKIIPVNVSIENKTYKPGQKVNGSVQIQNSSSSEVAIAVLDEAVFDLILKGREYFNPAKQLYSLDELNVGTFDNLLRIIGKREFKKKGANSGGDGLSSKDRETTKFVAYWNPSLKTDSDGKVSFSFDAPDNLTNWRVFAVALNESDKMGLGEGSFSVSKEIEIRPITPNQVIEDDTFKGEFTILNRTDSEKEVDVSITLSGSGISDSKTSEKILVKPFERKPFSIPVTAKTNGEIILKASARAGNFTDSFIQKIPVHRKASLETAAVYGSFDSDSQSHKILFPKDIRTDIGGIKINLAPTVLGGIEGAFSYMKNYPYLCWEQRLSKGVLALHYKKLKNYLPSFSWDESESITQKMLSDAGAFQAPNGGFTYYIPKDEYVDPYLSALTALSFSWLRDEGLIPQKNIEEKLTDYLITYLKKDSSPSFYSVGMAATSRAVALAALSSNGKIKDSEVVRFKEFVPQMSLFGKAMYYQALLSFPSLKKEQNDIKTILFQSSDETGGKLSFQEKIDTTTFERILTTQVRDNCSAMEALISSGTLNDDLAMKMVRSITETRKQSTYWSNTQENLFCTRALIKYAKIYEKQLPQGTWNVSLNGETLGDATFNSVSDKNIFFEKNIDKNDPGSSKELLIKRDGKGRAYFQSQLSFAPKDLKTESIVNGIEIRKEFSVKVNGKYSLLKPPFFIKRGDLVQVDLFISLPAARNFVVINDPIPGGFEPVNTELKTASAFDAQSAESPLEGGSYWYRFNDWIDFATSRWSFYHRELRHDSAKFYSEYLSPGNYHLSYAVQAIAPGKFTGLPAKAEEMYDPDIFGQTEPIEFLVQ